MATQYTNPQLKRLIDVNFAYPKNEPISALEARQVFYALVDSVPLLADGGFKTKLPTWTATPPAVPNSFVKDEPVIVAGVLYRAKRLITDSRDAPGTYTGWQDDWEAVGGGGNSGGLDVFPANTPVTAQAFLNLPAGSNIANQSLVDVLTQAFSQPYQVPSFTSFTIQDAGSQTVEVGTSFYQTPGFKSIKWSTGNSQNVQANTVGLVDVTANNAVLLSNEPNDGQASTNLTAFTVVKGESRKYRISAKNTQGATFSAELVISGLFKSYFGYANKKTFTVAELISLGNGVLQNGHARTVNGVTAGAGLYTVYSWEDNAGNDDVSQVLQDGVDSIRGAFGSVQRSTGPNALGATVTMAYIVSNATQAFTNSNLEFK